MVVPIYISELSPPAVRGRLVGIYELGWQIGGLVGFWINYGLSETMAPSHKQWLIPFAVQLIPAGILLIGALWLKESPRWLFTKDRRQEAIGNLCWIRNLPQDDIYMVEEVAFIDAAIEEQRATMGAGFWKVCTSFTDRTWGIVADYVTAFRRCWKKQENSMALLPRCYALLVAEWIRYQRDQLYVPPSS